MGIENKSEIAQATLYFGTFILSFLICIPAGLNVDNFDGHCLLAASGSWSNNGDDPDVQLNISEWGVSSACNFTIFIGVISLLLSLFYCVWSSILLAKGIQSTWRDTFINLVVNVLMCICLFATACTVSKGLRSWCDLLTQPGSGIQSCEDAQYIDLGFAAEFKTAHFYRHWGMAEFGLWCCWVFWVIITVMASIQQYSNHRREAFLTSINRERQRLLQRVGQSTESEA